MACVGAQAAVQEAVQGALRTEERKLLESAQHDASTAQARTFSGS